MGWLVKFDTVDFCILGIPAYFFCACCGFVVSICAYIAFMASKGYDLSQSVKTLFLSFTGMAFGAKLFGYLTGIYRDVGLGKPITLDSILDTGIVYYGGLMGLIAAYWLCLKRKQSRLDAHSLDVLAVCCPLFHAIARVGCFLSGCCYGRVHQGIFAITYTTTIGGIADVNPRVPVQLLEALFELLVFFYLSSQLHKAEWKSRRILLRYLGIYSIGRFFLEFLRGDIRRGVIHGVSFSQCVSMILWCVLLIHDIKQQHNKKYKESSDEYNIIVGP